MSSVAREVDKGHQERVVSPSSTDKHLWLFGYGSLIWKPPPHYDRRLPGYIHGYVRRFWQASEDHRGTPHHPGRVVTLIASPPSPAQDPLPRVWGAAYRIPAAHAVAARAHLDHREINGYSVQTALFHLRDEVDGDGDGDGKGAAREETSIECLVYVGLPTNPQFLGPQEPQALAERISRCRGPSGANVEYLYRLHEALAAVGGGDDDDDHVADLVRRCRELDARESADCPA